MILKKNHFDWLLKEWETGAKMYGRYMQFVCDVKRCRVTIIGKNICHNADQNIGEILVFLLKKKKSLNLIATVDMAIKHSLVDHNILSIYEITHFNFISKGNCNYPQ